MFFEVWGGLGQVLGRSWGVLGPSWRGLEAKMGPKMAPTSKILRSNFGLQFPMPSLRAGTSDGGSTVAENGGAGRGGGSDRTRLWRDLACDLIRRTSVTD